MNAYGDARVRQAMLTLLRQRTGQTVTLQLSNGNTVSGTLGLDQVSGFYEVETAEAGTLTVPADAVVAIGTTS